MARRAFKAGLLSSRVRRDAAVLVPRDEGDDDTADSDVDADGVMASTTLGSGEHDPDWDAGLHPEDP